MLKLLTVADIITIMNAVLGFLAILMVFSNQLSLAASFILLGLLADGFDGIVARRTRTGPIGEDLESIADMISLSIAPLILLYKTYSEASSSDLLPHLVLGGVLIFSLICSMIRLSSFSLMKEKQFFIGLPTSASAIFLVLLSVIHVDLLVVIIIVLSLAIAMLSPIRFPKPGLKMDGIAAIFIILTIILDGMYHNIAPLLLLTALVLYVIVGPLYLRRKKQNV